MSNQISTHRYGCFFFACLDMPAFQSIFQSAFGWYLPPQPFQHLPANLPSWRGLVRDRVIEHFCHDFAVFLFSRDFAQETRLPWSVNLGPCGGEFTRRWGYE